MSAELSCYNKDNCSDAKGKTFYAALLPPGPEAVSPIFDGEAAVYNAAEFAIALAL